MLDELDQMLRRQADEINAIIEPIQKEIEQALQPEIDKLNAILDEIELPDEFKI